MIALWVICGMVILAVLGMGICAQCQYRDITKDIETGPNPIMFHLKGDTELRQAAPAVLTNRQIEELQNYVLANRLPWRECPNCGWQFWLIQTERSILIDMRCRNCGELLTVDTASERHQACGTEEPKRDSVLT